MKTNLMDVGL